MSTIIEIAIISILLTILRRTFGVTFGDDGFPPADCGRSTPEKNWFQFDMHLIDFSLLLVCFIFDRIGDLGGEKIFADVVGDVVDWIWFEFSLILVVVLLFPNVSLKSGNEECWSRLTCDERLLWYNVASSLSITISLQATKTKFRVQSNSLHQCKS